MRELFRKHLDGDLALQVRVCRPIDLPHPAHADLGGDRIRAEAGAGSQGHEAGRIIGGSKTDSAFCCSPREWLAGRMLVAKPLAMYGLLEYEEQNEA